LGWQRGFWLGQAIAIEFAEQHRRGYTPMRRALHHGTVARVAAASSPANAARSGDVPRKAAEAKPSADPAPVCISLSPAASKAKISSAAATAPTDREARLVAAITQRIESRLPGRVRNLHVRVTSEGVVIEGFCATYYTKQLAQHAALGVLEDEHLENAIVVTVGR
jgi:hypothetical protein